MQEMEACWPSSVGLRGQALNRPGAALAEDRRGERPGRRRGVMRQVGTRKTFQKRSRGVSGWACAVEASISRSVGIEIGGPEFFSRDEPGGCPCYWPGGARRRGGVILVCGSCTEREKASVENRKSGARRAPGSRERERAEAETEGIRQGLSDLTLF